MFDVSMENGCKVSIVNLSPFERSPHRGWESIKTPHRVINNRYSQLNAYIMIRANNYSLTN